MNIESKIIIEEVSKSLVKAGIPLKGLYFFGSRAKELQTKESDYDIAVIIKLPVNHKIKDKVRSFVYEIMLEHNVVIDTHIYSESEIDKPVTPFREAIRNEGVFYAI